MPLLDDPQTGQKNRERLARLGLNDPQGDGANLFQFVDDDPTTLLDPTGLDAQKKEVWHPDDGLNLDLILVADPDFWNAYQKGYAEYSKKHPSCQCQKADDLNDLLKKITARYNQVNQNSKKPRGINVLIIGHGGETGPFVGKNDIVDLPVTNSWQELAKQSDAEIQRVVAQSQLAQLKGQIAALEFTACGGDVANEAHRIFQALANIMNAAIAAANTGTNTTVYDNGVINVEPGPDEKIPPGGFVWKSK